MINLINFNLITVLKVKEIEWVHSQKKRENYQLRMWGLCRAVMCWGLGANPDILVLKGLPGLVYSVWGWTGRYSRKHGIERLSLWRPEEEGTFQCPRQKKKSRYHHILHSSTKALHYVYVAETDSTNRGQRGRDREHTEPQLSDTSCAAKLCKTTLQRKSSSQAQNNT